MALHPLAYSRPPALPWVSQHRRLLLALALLGATSLPVWHSRATLMQRADWLYWSDRCASHRMPGPIDLVITDAARARGLLTADDDYEPKGTGCIYSPRAWRMLERADPRCFWISSAVDDGAIVFLGALRRPDGTWRLVVVRGANTNAYDLLAFTRVLVLPHPKPFEPFPGQVVSAGSCYSGRWRDAQLRGASHDPKDASHILLPFDVNPEIPGGGSLRATGLIDGYLQNDDSLSFRLRETPELSRLDVEFRRTNISGGIPSDAGRLF